MIWKFLKKSEIQLLDDWQSNSGCIAEGYEYRISKRYLPSHVHWSVVDSKQNIETTYRSILVALVVQNLPSNAGDIGHTGSTPAMTWRRAWQSTPVFLPGETMDRGALQGIAHGIAKSWIRLKWLNTNVLQWINKDVVHIYYTNTMELFSCEMKGIPNHLQKREWNLRVLCWVK